MLPGLQRQGCIGLETPRIGGHRAIGNHLIETIGKVDAFLTGDILRPARAERI